MQPDRKPNADVIAKALDGDELAPWEEQFARWMALQSTRVDYEDEQAAVRILVGHDLSRTALRATKTKHAWKRVYQNARAEANETFIQTAKNRFAQSLPRAAAAGNKSMKILNRELDKVIAEPGIDPLPLLRSVPMLINPMIDRIQPRKTETQTTATQIVVNLTPEQAKGLGAPVRVIEAEEVLQLPETTDAA